MKQFWDSVNGLRTIVGLVVLFAVAVVWVNDLSRDVEELEARRVEFSASSTQRVHAVDRKIEDLESKVDRLERNLLLLGAKWNVPMEQPPANR